jgi:hypothetical protein
MTLRRRHGLEEVQRILVIPWNDLVIDARAVGRARTDWLAGPRISRRMTQELW